MAMTRRRFLSGMALGAAASVLRVRQSRAASTVANAGAYFAGAGQDNGFSYRLTNFAKIDPSLRRQLVQLRLDAPRLFHGRSLTPR